MSDNYLIHAVARANSKANLMLSWLNNGSLQIYSGTRPTSPDVAVTTQINLCSFTFSNPSGTVSSGIFSAATFTAAIVKETGFASWARLLDLDGFVIADCSVGITNSGALVELSTVNLVKDIPLKILNFTLIEL
jgi:hypothetical protein